MIAKIITQTHPQAQPMTPKEIDWDKPGNRRWLVNHLTWALNNGVSVTITNIY